MRDEVGGCLFFCLVSLLVVGVVSFAAHLKGDAIKECRIRAEYALSAADTVALVRQHPACAVTVYGEGR